MRTLPAAIIAQKNAISTAGAWLLFADIAFTGETTLRLVNNTSNVSLGGVTYTKWAFGLGQVKESVKGDLPRVTFTLYDVNLSMRSTLLANDGWSGGEITLQRAFVTKAGAAANAEILQYFTILSTTWDDNTGAVCFDIGVSSPLSRRFPRDRYSATICRHKFRDGFCRYAGGDITTVYNRFYSKADSDTAFARLDIGVPGNTGDFTAGQRIRIAGTAHNDNEYVIGSVMLTSSDPHLYLTANYNFTSENLWISTAVRVYVVCNHSITDCRVLNNSHMFGASPGVSEGLYG